MKTSEIFTRGSSLAGFDWRRRACDGRRFTASLDLYVAAGRKPKLAFGDHGFAGLQPPVNHQFLIHARTGDHRPHLNRSILLDHVNELAILSGLHSLIGNHGGVRPRGQPSVTRTNSPGHSRLTDS